MRSAALRILAGVCLFTSLGLAGPRSVSGALYERIICVVPMVGAGTLDDPKRPMFAPVAGQMPAERQKKSKGFADPPVIIGYRSVMADDGQTAIVEFVARDRAAFRPILQSNDASVRVFDPQKIAADTLLEQLRLLKKDFDLSAFAEGGL